MSGYDTDLVLWSREQADLLRRMAAGERVNDQVDWANLAEEIESLGKSDRRDVEGRLETVLRHLIKLALSPAIPPRAGWRRTIVEQRSQLERVLQDSPSLRAQLPDLIRAEFAGAKRLALMDLAEHAEQPALDPDSLEFTPDQVLGPELPE
jgi:hypothetical protein